MAIIQTSFQLFDRMTAPLMAINNTMNVVINLSGAMQGASSRPIDTAALQYARQQLASAYLSLKGAKKYSGYVGTQYIDKA